MNIVDDFIDKKICPYDGKELKRVKDTFGDLVCPKCKSYFRFIDSFATGYYFPRKPRKGDYCLKGK